MTPLRLPRGLFGILACLGAGPFLGAATEYTPYHFKVIAGIPGVIGSADSAVLLTLPAGAYTVLVSGAGGSSGIGLVEVFEIY